MSSDQVDANFRAVALIQARMGSTRLPGKMMMPIGKHPLLEWVLRRVRQSRFVTRGILLTSEDKKNDPLVTLARNLNFEVLRGDENDVLSRFLRASLDVESPLYLRICADNPFICPKEIDRLIEFHYEGQFDYSFNHIPKESNNYADGFGAEAISQNIFAQLLKIHSTLTPSQKEHVTKYIWDNRVAFNIGVLKAPSELAYPDLEFDVDTFEDYRRINKIAELIDFSTTGAEVIKLTLKEKL